MDKRQNEKIAEFSMKMHANGQLIESIKGPHQKLVAGLACMFEDVDVIELFLEALVRRIDRLQDAERELINLKNQQNEQQ
jgi:hypothetical protein